MRIRTWLMLAAMAGLMVAPVAKAQTTQPAETVVEAKPEPMDDTGAKPAEGGDGKPAPGDQGGGGGQGRDQGQGGGGSNLLLPAVLFGGLILMWVFMGRGRKKEQRRRQEMLSAIKKGDKVTSIGGIIGTVMDVKGDEITVKVDESNNTRMKFARWAVRGVGDAAKAENPAGSEKRP